MQNRQTNELLSGTKLVTITVGGDNPIAGYNGGLFAVLIRCGQDKRNYFSCTLPLALLGRGWSGSYATIKIALENLYMTILKKAGNAQFYVLGYPNPFPSELSTAKLPGNLYCLIILSFTMLTLH